MNSIGPYLVRMMGVLIPIVALFIPIVAIIGGLWVKAHSDRLKSEQRMAMLARGISLAEIEAVFKQDTDANSGRSGKDPIRSLANARRTATVLISTGLGLIAFFCALEGILHKHSVFAAAAVGLIPLIIGLGFVVDYHLQKRELSRFGLEIDANPRHD